MNRTHDVSQLSPVLLFSGKGGVGKTTLAAATAVHLADAGSRVLIVSTDPAHSLSDVFGTPLGPTPKTIHPGIDAMEVDARSMFDGAFSTTEEGALSKMMQLAAQAPGIDEFGAVEVLLQAIEQADHDAVILDTAPTGHTLRLLALPELLDGWFGTLLQLRGQLARAGKLLKRLWPGGAPKQGAQTIQEGITESRDRVSALRAMLTDPQKAQIFLVSIPEAMSVLETLRTLDLLRSQQLPVGAVIVNQMQPASQSCQHCARRREIHQGALDGLRGRLEDTPLRVLESEAREIRGVGELRKLAGQLWDTGPQRPAH